MATAAAAIILTTSLTASAFSWVYSCNKDPKQPYFLQCGPTGPLLDSKFKHLDSRGRTSPPLPFWTNRLSLCRNSALDVASLQGASSRQSTTALCEASAVNTELENTPDLLNDDDTVLATLNRRNPNLSYKRMSLPDRARISTHAILGALLKPNLIEQYDVYRHHGIVVKGEDSGSQKVLVPAMQLAEKSLENVKETSSAIYAADGREVVTAIVRLGHGLDGHQGVVHGGILALIIDDVLGFGYEALSDDGDDRSNDSVSPAISYAVTANLNVNYTAPVPSGATILVTAALVQPPEMPPHPRKLHWMVSVTSPPPPPPQSTSTLALDDPDETITYCRASSLFIIPRAHHKEAGYNGAGATGSTFHEPKMCNKLP